MSEGVIDSSSVLVVIKLEPGAEFVLERLALGTHYLSTVNAAEVLSRLSDYGLTAQDASMAVGQLQLVQVAFNDSHAAGAAALRRATRPFGLSLGDRACLAWAIELGLPVLTADRAWSQVDLPIEVMLTR